MPQPYRYGMDLIEAASILARTPAVLDTLLAGLPAQRTHRADSPGAWSIHDHVSHLLHRDATDWLSRTRMISGHVPSRVIDLTEPEDEAQGTDPTTALLGRFRAVRRGNISNLASLGIATVDLGDGSPRRQVGAARLAHLIAAWAAHDLTHLAQISEALARSYRGEIESWPETNP